MTTPIQPDDPRLTALALGEIDDADLATDVTLDEALHAEVDAIRAAAGLLAESYRAEPVPALTEAQRAKVLAGEGIAEDAETAMTRDDQLIEPPPGYWTRRRKQVAAVSVAAALALFWLITPVHVACAECWDSGEKPRIVAVADAVFPWLEAVRGSGIENSMDTRGSISGADAATVLGYLFAPPAQGTTAQRLASGSEPLGQDRLPESAAESEAAAGPAAAAMATPEIAIMATALYRQIMATAAPKGPDTSGVAAPAPSIQKIIKNADMTVEVADVGTGISRIEAAMAELGGYETEKRTDFSSGNLPSATMVVAVPVAHFEDLLQRIRESADKVVSEQASGRDATKEYVDLQSQIANLEATQARIRDFLAQAKNVEEALQVNAQLKDIEGQLGQLKGQLNFLGQRAAYSTITINLRQTPPFMTATPTPTPVPSPTPVAWRPGTTARAAYHTLSGLSQWLADIAIWLTIVVGPFLVLALGLWWLTRRMRWMG